MKYQRVVEIVTESYEEEQFILNKFPEACWYASGPKTNTVFYLPVSKEHAVQEAYNEYKARSNR